MEQELYNKLAEREEKLWWYIARRKILSHLLHFFRIIPEKGTVLDIGCGSGKNLVMLSAFTDQLYGIESNPEMHAIAAKRQIAKEIICSYSIQDAKLEGKQFDTVTMFDVLEHIKDDKEVLRAINSHLNNKGKIIFTVPAFPFLWSGHDVANHHYRRYTMASLKNIVESTGFSIIYLSYFNFWLFPLLMCTRLWKKYFGYQQKAQLSIPGSAINKLLTAIFSSECRFLGKISFPFGGSVIVIAEKITR